MKRFPLLLTADPAEGGQPPQTATQINTPQTGAVNLPPHTAAVVLNATVTERETELQKQIDELRAQVGGTTSTIRAREQRINELEDENRQLKLAREAHPAAKKTRGQWKKGWKGYALADDDDADEETED